MEKKIPEYISALENEVNKVGLGASERPPVHTIFFGGGTPSLLPVPGLKIILDAVEKKFDILPDCEMTLETNPGTVSLEKLQALQNTGFNRISFGMQSARQSELELLGRLHNHEETIQAVNWAREAGFLNINLDLIFGLPGQDLSNWKTTLEAALDLGVEHLSLYALTVEDGVLLQTKIEAGLFPYPDDDEAAEMYEFSMSRLAEAGYSQYEISNWARTDSKSGNLLACLHNLQYWRSQPYFGFGAGAHGYVGHIRTSNVLSVDEYVFRLNSRSENNRFPFPASPAALEVNHLDIKTEMEEFMMVGLRLTREGISKYHFESKFGISFDRTFGIQTNRLIGQGLLEWAGEYGDSLRLTKRGRLLGNRVFMEYVNGAAI